MIKKNAMEWDMLTDTNSRCPICHKVIKKDEDDIEYSETVRGSRIFFHGECVRKKV